MADGQQDNGGGNAGASDATTVGRTPRDVGPDDPTGPLSQPASVRSLPARLRAVYARHVGDDEKSLLQAYAAFDLTFGFVRALTHTLRRRDAGSGGSGGIVVRGRHLHHYNIGIVLLATVGGIAVRGGDRHARHVAHSAAYGTGVALIVDELALLIDLADVYWANDGRTSVDAAIGVIGVGGAVLAAVPFWQGATREVLRTRPALPGGARPA